MFRQSSGDLLGSEDSRLVDEDGGEGGGHGEDIPGLASDQGYPPLSPGQDAGPALWHGGTLPGESNHWTAAVTPPAAKRTSTRTVTKLPAQDVRGSNTPSQISCAVSAITAHGRRLLACLAFG